MPKDLLYFTFLTFHLKLANTHKKQSFPRFLLPLTIDGNKAVSDIDEFLPGVTGSLRHQNSSWEIRHASGETLGDGTAIGQVGRQTQVLL